MLVSKATRALFVASVLAVSGAFSLATAQQSGERPTPPPEAIEACNSQVIEGACSFSGPRGEVTGTCVTGPQNAKGLICMPEGGRPPPPRGKDKN